MIEEKDEIQLDEIKIGKFKPKRKFLNFVQGRKSNIRFISNFAYVRGKQLSGVLEDVIFKVTIQSEGTIDFEEVDTNLCDEDTIKRLIDDIDSKDVTGYMHKYVVYGLDFEDEDGKKFYLEVEEEKPINKLFNLFNEIENEEMDIEVSENANSILDALFSSETEEELQREFEGESDEDIQKEREQELTQNTEVEKPKSFLELEFEKLNMEKVQELTDRIEKKEKEIQKSKFDISQGEANLKKAIHDHGILNSRLESLKPKEDPNGYVFFVSEENKTGIEASDEVKSVVEKIAPILKLNAPVVIDMLTKGYYTIRISEKSDLKLEDVVYNQDIHKKISKIDISGKVKMVSTGEYEYRGELNWHQLVDKLIKLGFEQEPEFDKMCGSNSYQSNVEDEIKNESNEESNQDFTVIEEKGTFDAPNENGYVAKTLTEFNKPTDIYIVGDGLGDNSDFAITDDETSFSLHVDGERSKDIHSMGWGKILNEKEFKIFRHNYLKSYGSDAFDCLGGVFIPNFSGKIEITSKLYDGGWSKDFDETDFIEHQVDGEVVINIPSGFKVYELNDDWTLPVEAIRELKIDKLIK